MEPTDPFEDETHTVRFDGDGMVREVEMTTGQALDLAAGKPIAYFPHNEESLVGEDGQIVERESAIPPDDAA